MTLHTPTPPGVPDFTTAQLQPGQKIISDAFTGSGSATGAVGYCGNVPSVFIMCALSGAATQCEVQVMWSLSNVAGSPLIAGDIYVINPNSTVTIVDCLPVLAPYVYLVYTHIAGGSWTIAATVTTSLQSVRGTPQISGGGTCISTTATVVHGTSVAVYGSYLSPGLYTWALNPNTTVTSTTATLTIMSGVVPTFGVLALIFNPVANTFYGGQVVVGNCQPIWYLSNSNASTLWTPAVYLTGPQV